MEHKKLKVVELFGGIGAIRKALMNVGLDCDFLDYVEFDKVPVKQYNAMYGENYEPKNVLDWQPPQEEIDLLVHGSPCQDFSVAGKGDVENGGRSILYQRTLSIVGECKPKVVIWENVKGLLSKKHRHHYDEYLTYMELSGYNNYYKILVATDFGIPQKRERVFTVSIRRDVDKGTFNWDNLETKPMQPLKEFLEDEVDISYFLKQASMINAIKQNKVKIVDGTVTTKQMRWNNAGVIKVPLTTFSQENVIHDTNNPIPTFTAQGANSRIKIAIEAKDSSNYIILPRQKDGQCISGAYNRAWKADKENVIVGTIATSTIPKIAEQGIDTDLPIFIIDDKPYVVRILTEREAFRLMGFTDEDFNKASSTTKSKAHLYKAAGNSIVVQVLEAIVKELYKDEIKKEN